MPRPGIPHLRGGVAKLNRQVLIRRIALLTIGASLIPGAASARSQRRITETRTITRVGAQGKPGTHTFHDLGAGTLDGRIGGRPVHGAERTSSKIIETWVDDHHHLTGRELVHGTQFDARGSRSFLLHLNYTVLNQQIILLGTGNWTGGTGSYRRARGTFRISGGGPLGGVHTTHLTGTISY